MRALRNPLHLAVGLNEFWICPESDTLQQGQSIRLPSCSNDVKESMLLHSSSLATEQKGGLQIYLQFFVFYFLQQGFTVIIRAAGPWTDTSEKKNALARCFFSTHHGDLITTIVSHNTNSKSFQPLSFLEYSHTSTRTCPIAKTRLKSSIRCV